MNAAGAVILAAGGDAGCGSSEPVQENCGPLPATFTVRGGDAPDSIRFEGGNKKKVHYGTFAQGKETTRDGAEVDPVTYTRCAASTSAFTGEEVGPDDGYTLNLAGENQTASLTKTKVKTESDGDKVFNVSAQGPAGALAGSVESDVDLPQTKVKTGGKKSKSKVTSTTERTAYTFTRGGDSIAFTAQADGGNVKWEVSKTAGITEAEAVALASQLPLSKG